MLDEKDRQWLEKSAGKEGAVRQALYLIIALFMLLMAAVNVLLAFKWGGLAHVSPLTLLRGWAGVFKPDAVYTGVYLRGLDRLTVAVIQFLVALFIGPLALFERRQRIRDQKTIGTLKRGGIW